LKWLIWERERAKQRLERFLEFDWLFFRSARLYVMRLISHAASRNLSEIQRRGIVLFSPPYDRQRWNTDAIETKTSLDDQNCILVATGDGRSATGNASFCQSLRIGEWAVGRGFLFFRGGDKPWVSVPQLDRRDCYGNLLAIGIGWGPTRMCRLHG